MEAETYTLEDVIAALNGIGYVDENVINYIVPIIAYESREGGVPFVQDAKDPTSDSWGIYQTNINTEMSAIYKVMEEEGVELPGMSKLQKKQLSTNVVGEKEKDVRKFTNSQKKVVREFLKNADLSTQTKVFKEMYEIKSKEIKSDKTEDVMSSLYFNTTRKFYTDKQPEALEFKDIMDKELKLYTKRKMEEDYKKEQATIQQDEINKFKRMAAAQQSVNPTERTQSELNMMDKYKRNMDSELNNSLINVYSTLSEAKKRAIQSGANIL